MTSCLPEGDTAVRLRLQCPKINRDQGYSPDLTSEAGRMMIRLRFAEALLVARASERRKREPRGQRNVQRSLSICSGVS
jgi:hypothetical protein